MTLRAREKLHFVAILLAIQIHSHKQIEEDTVIRSTTDTMETAQ